VLKRRTGQEKSAVCTNVRKQTKMLERGKTSRVNKRENLVAASEKRKMQEEGSTVVVDVVKREWIPKQQQPRSLFIPFRHKEREHLKGRRKRQGSSE
jgi:hypothetical protein